MTGGIGLVGLGRGTAISGIEAWHGGEGANMEKNKCFLILLKNVRLRMQTTWLLGSCLPCQAPPVMLMFIEVGPELGAIFQVQKKGPHLLRVSLVLVRLKG